MEPTSRGGRPLDPRDGLRRALSLLEATIEATADGLLVVDEREDHPLQPAVRGDLAPTRRGARNGRGRASPRLRDRPAPRSRSLPREGPGALRDPEASSFDSFELVDGRTSSATRIPQRLDARDRGTRLELPRRHRPPPGRGGAPPARGAGAARQKLESLGVLAGGIAHDFNNILTAILGNADLALSLLSESRRRAPMLEEIERASRRAADLCRQLLAYSGKGRFVVRPIDLSKVVEEMAHLLEVSVSKGAALRMDLARDLPAVAADARSSARS